MPDNMVALRCKYCGAALDAESVKGDSPYVTCPSCGTTQQRIDAEAYLEQLMGQVRSWINKAVPGGIGIAQSQNVDSVARYNIYVNNVKPRLDLEFNEYKFALMSLLAHPMMVMPFSIDTSIQTKHSTEQVFGFGEKVKGVEPLAVDPDSRKSLNEAMKITDAYALLINNTKILKENKDGRYILMDNNFKEASKDFSEVDGYGPAAHRFAGLSQLSQGCEKLLNGDVNYSVGLFEKGKSELEEAKKGVFGNMKVAIMGNAVNSELNMGNALVNLAGRINGIGDPLAVLDAVRKLNNYSYPDVGQWASLLRNRDRMGEIFDHMAACVSGRNGGTLNIAKGGGNALVPFWNVRLRYSFQTGTMWKKHSVEVDETLLIPADFVIDKECLSNPRSGVTDVFASATSEGIVASLSGRETSISGGQGLKALVQSAAQNAVGARKVVVPISTRREAERIAEQYVGQASQYVSKLKLSNPDVMGLVYVPCKLSGNRIIAPSEFGTLTPARIGRTDVGQLIVV